MNEREFQAWVMKEFKKHGWTVKHVPTPMRPVKQGHFVPDSRGRGLLDLQCMHSSPPRLAFAEIKALGGELSEAQIEVIRLLRLVVDIVREAVRPLPCPLGVFVFQPGNEALVTAVASGAAFS